MSGESEFKKSENKLIGFEDYDSFVRYTQTLFNLEPDQYQALFKVLLKLQSLGQKPVKVLQECKNLQGDNDCLDMLKFMIYVDGMDLAGIKESL